MGRSRLTPEREAELYAAVLDLLREVGYDALTMDAVAARTHASKATLYRQWQGKPELVAKALHHHKPVHLADIDTGSIRGDLHAMVSRGDDCEMERDSALLRGLVRAAHDNPDLHRALRDLLINPDVSGLGEMLTRAVERGEIPAGRPALSYVPHMLVGAFVAQQLIEDRPPDRAFLAAYVDAVVLPALGV
ncbi:TetR/AcrR family transcriptional regulator [Streptomyces sp. Ac-502]|uniref:TetR/AcrR family transcriptional regulator n=1 Tax=Streptomyces sp. Ac-502 TaxID=3342801 RepID=UPI003862B8F8